MLKYYFEPVQSNSCVESTGSSCFVEGSHLRQHGCEAHSSARQFLRNLKNLRPLPKTYVLSLFRVVVVVLGVKAWPPMGANRSFLVEKEGFDAAGLDFGKLVADNLGQHLRELHAQRFIHKGVKAEVEKPADHLHTRTMTAFMRRVITLDMIIPTLLLFIGQTVFLP